MKNLLLQAYPCLALVLFLAACGAKKEPLPELSYTGESPRVQEPLAPEASQKHIQLPAGFETILYASEPEIINPIALAWDEKGRLWVVQSQDYPHELENEVGGDRITICEDTDGDGKADTFKDFATEQSLTTGIVIMKGGVIVAQAPEIVFLEDTDGDDVMDQRTVLFDGFGTWDTHAGPANLKYGPDNQIWGSVGYSGFEHQFGDEIINFTRGVYRFSRDGQGFEPLGQFDNNTWGLGFTQNFEIFGSTANNNHCCYVGIPLRHYDYLDSRPSWAINADFIQGHYEMRPATAVPLQQVDVRGGFTAVAGANFYTATNYPTKYRDQMYVNEPTGHLVHLARIVPDGAGYKEEDGGNIFASTDAWTAPVYSETGPDGNLWVADWYNPVIQHNPDKRGMPNQIWNDQWGQGNAHINELRDKRHGRIYIITHEKNKKSEIKALNPEGNKELLAALDSDNLFWRMTAQRLIVEHERLDLVPDLLQLAATESRAAMHALRSLDGLGAMEGTKDLLAKALDSKMLGLQRTGLALLPETQEAAQLLVESGLLTSSNLNIRLSAILRASELPETDALYQAIEAIAEVPENQNDKWLNAALKIYFRTPNVETISKEQVLMVLPASDDQVETWRYSEEKPEADWMGTYFDDSSWAEGEAMFGTPDLFPAIKSPWTSPDIWMRRKVQLEETLEKPVLKVRHDEDYEVYVNGQLLFKQEGYNSEYQYIRLEEELGQLFKKGENTLAVHCHNKYGNQFIDIGIGKVGSFVADKSMTLNTVPQKMAYDQTVLHAMAGQQLELILNNTDEMPHNLVLIETGSLDAFGKLVDKFLQSPDAAALDYVPKSRYVLGATKMLEPGESGAIRMQVPDQPGDYPFVCTFPGHWQMMQGVLKVSARGSYIADAEDAFNIAVMAGGSSHQFRKFFGVADGKVMSEGGLNTVQYTENSLELESWLSEADLLCISNNKAFEASTKAAIFERVNSGMPMMIYHPSAWYNWRDWPEYNRELVAGGSESHEKFQEFEVEVVKLDHPIMQGVPKTFRITDELYRWKQDPKGPAIEVLAIGRGLESGETFPVVWVVKHPKTTIVCNTLGHDQEAHDLPAYQTILKNSVHFLKGERLGI